MNMLKEFDVNTKKVVTTFGRFTVITQGHLKLVNKIAQEAQNRNADYRIYLSHSQDRKKNPLSYQDKVKFFRKAAPKHKRNVIESRSNNILEVATELYEDGYEELVIVVGQDRVKAFQDLIERYNGKKARHGFYEFVSIDVVSAGDRDPDAEGVVGMSASKMREMVYNGDFASFFDALPDTLSDDDKTELYEKVRKGMGIRENKLMKGFRDFLTDESEDDFELFLEEIVGPDQVHLLEKKLSNQELKKVEKFADSLFNRIGVDVKFSKHFKQRVNDPRNKEPITVKELIRIFQDTFKRYGKTIKQMGVDTQAVIKDMITNINIPFALNADPNSDDTDMVSKTIMRKPNFMTSNPTLKLNSYQWKKNLQRIAEIHTGKSLNEKIEPGENESQKEFHSRCMSKLVGEEDYDQDQANAICYSKWERRNE